MEAIIYNEKKNLSGLHEKLKSKTIKKAIIHKTKMN